MFTRLHLRNFRGFAELDLPDLGSINLIVGRNNSGKTSLLEALWIACQPDRFAPDLPGQLRAVPGNVGSGYFRWLVKDGSTSPGEIRAEREHGPERIVKLYGRGMATPSMRNDRSYRSDYIHADWTADPQADCVRCCTASPLTRDESKLVQLFDRAMSQRGGEEAIENLLKQVDPRVKRIRLRAPTDQPAFIEVDLGLSERIPLSQVGHGLSRLVAIFSELLAESPDVYLVDEIENGVHHSLLPQIWIGLGAAARERNVQIFAATHSYECILAAHEAFAAGSSYDLRIIQLFRSVNQASGGVQGRVLDRRLIEAAVRGEVDLR